MGRSVEGQRRRLAKLVARIASPEDNYLPLCSVPDPRTGKACGRRTARASKQGLNAIVCRYHQQYKQRHGSHWCKSPSAAVLTSYIQAARTVIRQQTADPFVSSALFGIGSLMSSAGPVEIATRLKGLPPMQRAIVCLARLREWRIAPERLLAIVLAVHALIEDAPGSCHRIRDWRIVAIAKAAHRLASGTHKVWPVPQPDGRVVHIEMHAYPRSSGRVLRHLGTMIETECELVIDRHLQAVVALKRAADRTVLESATTRAFPK